MKDRTKLPLPLQLVLVVSVFVLLVSTTQFFIMVKELAAIGSDNAFGSRAFGAQILFPLACRPVVAILAAFTMYFLLYRPVRSASRLSLVLVTVLTLILVWSAINWFTGTGSASYSQASDLGRVVFPAVRFASISLLVALALFVRPYAID